MKKLYPIVFALLATFQAEAQNEIQSFGKVEIGDLEMKECAFEKDANAMYLFNKGEAYFDQNFDIVFEVHKRIKILNEKGKGEANIHLEYWGGNKLEDLTGLQAQTINLVDGKPQIFKVDKKTIFNEVIDKSRSAISFSFPNVQAGSIIEYKYKLSTPALGNFPNWYFQSNIPVKYSQLTTSIPEYFYYKTQTHTSKAYDKNVHKTESRSSGGGTDALLYNEEKDIRALANIPSLIDEPYMTSRADNLESVKFQLTTIRPPRGFVRSLNDTWPKVGGALADDEDFGKQFRKKLSGEDVIIAKAMAMKTNADRIAYIFNEVRNTMKWNGSDIWYTNDGTAKAWEKKVGNSTEINLIVYRLLKESGVKAYPMIVSTKDNGKINVAYPGLRQFNKTITYIPVDSTLAYYLDATNKYQPYNEIPEDLLNSNGLYVDKDNKVFSISYIRKPHTVRNISFVNAEIKPDGHLEGTVTINSNSYKKLKYTEFYKRDGEEKYKDYLRDNDNNIKISSLKLENLDIDTLPLMQKIEFKMDLAGSDESYIYVNPNLFSSLKSNPFVGENRSTAIDFGYMSTYLISGLYKVPVGFKVDALPKNISMVTPDQSIVFKRVALMQDGVISIRYNVDFKKTVHLKDNYAALHEFYKKMFEMLNEPIVLKKS
ncbi:MAG: hypothetical protein JWN56_2383 [Sphingobacteriales bacterium]|nr:hypothetical protein [Sphingobacteriales bacterium]